MSHQSSPPDPYSPHTNFVPSHLLFLLHTTYPPMDLWMRYKDTTIHNQTASDKSLIVNENIWRLMLHLVPVRDVTGRPINVNDLPPR